MWYVIQTTTGKEAELVNVMNNLLADDNEQDCFCIRREYVWRKEGHPLIQTEMLFPSYVFVRTVKPEALFFLLKNLSQFAKLLGDAGQFWPIADVEKNFLERLINGDKEHIIRRIPVKVDAEGRIKEAEGILEAYSGKIVKQRLRKRYVLIEVELLGKVRRIPIGIRLENDDW